MEWVIMAELAVELVGLLTPITSQSLRAHRTRWWLALAVLLLRQGRQALDLGILPLAVARGKPLTDQQR